MNAYPHDLPLDQEDFPRMIPWIVGVMVYLATLSLVAAVSLNKFVVQWDAEFRNGFSVELSPPEGNSSESLKQEFERQRRILNVLTRLPGIKRTQIIAKTSLSSTADSWLGTEEQNLGLPLPTIIDVEIIPHSSFDFEKLQVALNEIAPGTRLLKDREWREGLRKISKIFLGISIFVAALIGFATLAISSFTTHTGLVIHRRIVEILHIVGAQNTYIARQFQRYTLRIGLKASGIGVFLSFVTFFLLFWVGSQFELPHLWESFPLLEMILISGFIPPFITVIMMLTARLTVLWEMKKLYQL